MCFIDRTNATEKGNRFIILLQFEEINNYASVFVNILKVFFGPSNFGELKNI